MYVHVQKKLDHERDDRFSVHYIRPFHFRIKKKDILTEKRRQETLNRIITNFASLIDNEGGFKEGTKTALKCKRLGTCEGIKAMMERWFLIQELYGVLNKMLNQQIVQC